MTLTQEREKRLPEIARHIDRILSEVLKALSARLQEDLVSVVLFGSHARGNPRQHSDIDLVIVVKNLPSGWRERGALELSIESGSGSHWARPSKLSQWSQRRYVNPWTASPPLCSKPMMPISAYLTEEGSSEER